ncbi:hypothetical protein KC326_g189 [Hortaea werneckii]|nr:hypothetical protein KC326_g189 [Hortaea werneckii]
MPLQIELVLLQPRDVELLSATASLELTRDVLFVVPHDLRNDTCGRYTFRALSNQEHSALFDRLVDIVAFASAVRKIVVSHIVNLVLFQELDVDNPRAIFNDLTLPSDLSSCASQCRQSRRQSSRCPGKQSSPAEGLAYSDGSTLRRWAGISTLLDALGLPAVPFSAVPLVCSDLTDLVRLVGGSADLRSLTSSKTGSAASSPEASLELGWGGCCAESAGADEYVTSRDWR